MVNGVPPFPICSNVCRASQLGKQHQEWFPRSQSFAIVINKLIHFDICVPFPIKYFVDHIIL
jgi:hypothetical protein